MPRPRRRPHRIIAIVLLLTTVVQLPSLALVSRWIGGDLALRALPYFVAAALTATFLVVQFRPPLADVPKPAWLRFGLLLPFFAWWATSAIYCMLAPIAWVIGALSHVSSAQSSTFAFGLSALAGLWSARSGPRLVELDVEVAGLPTAFDGYRIAQISDIHCGSFTPKRTIDRWVAAMNAQRPDLIAVTGDLITSGDAYTEDVAAALSALDAPDGVYACMGNHDYFCDAERLVAALREGGLRVLRNEGEHVTRDGARLYIAGIEDAWTDRHDLPRTLAARDGAPTILLAHDPNHFPAAVKEGVALQLSGHTHGGQAALPVADGRFNLARLITRYTHGLFREGASQLYVSRGAGTTGPPLRLFAPAELTFLTLRAANEVDRLTD